MNISRFLLVISTLTLFIISLSSCGLTGGTSSVTVKPDKRILTGSLTDKVILNYFDIGEYATTGSTMDKTVSKTSLFNTGFSQSDKKVFTNSIVKSLNQVIWPQNEQTRTLKLEILLRGHFVASGSIHISALGIWYWRITDENETIIYQEQFYASDSNVDQIWQTVGAIKNKVNKYAIYRILHTAILVASKDTLGDIPMFDHTYNTLEKASKGLPTSYAVFSMPVYLTNDIYIFTDSGKTIHVDWKMAEEQSTPAH